HYNVNASVPKTLVKHLVRWVAGNGSLAAEANRVLEEIAATSISPELVPGDAAEKPAQSSEDAVGPYELQDFHLYQVLRFGYAPAVSALALFGCSLGPHTVELSQARLQELVARRFPVDKRVLDAIDLTLDEPRVGLQPEANRISVEVALRAKAGGPISTRLS